MDIIRIECTNYNLKELKIAFGGEAKIDATSEQSEGEKSYNVFQYCAKNNH